MSHAYVHTGLDQPGHCRVLFSATHAGPAGLGLPVGTEHPGRRLSPCPGRGCRCLPACLPARHRKARALPLAIELWASLHGIVDLRITQPEMPWPDPGALVDTALIAIRAAAPTADSTE